jgi:dTDP-glucose 4,6-dehydratase
MDKYLIIGSNSFSGSHFVHYLNSKKQKVIGVSRSKELNKVFLPYKWNKKKNNFKFYQININTQLKSLLKLVKKFKPKYIVNFAAQGMVEQSWLSPEDWYQTNVLAQVKLHNELRKIKSIKKYIHITTPEVYGNTKKWIKENFKFQPSTPYAVSRASCDFHLMSFYRNYNFPVIFTRAANVYGPGQQLYRIIPKAMISAKLGKKINLHGRGISKRSFIYIEDVCDALYRIVQRGKIGETYHISTNKIISIRELVKKISIITSTKFYDLVKISKERRGKDHAYLLNTSKLRKKLNWKDKTSLDNGMKKTLYWIDKKFNYLKKISRNYKHKI